MAKNSAHPLIGRAFHTVDERGRTRWQGEFIAVVGDYALAQLYDCIVGTRTTQHLLHLSDLASIHSSGLHKFRIFDCLEHANGYMEAYAKYRDENIDAEEAKTTDEESA